MSKRAREDDSYTQNLERDFAGEFAEIRKSHRAVDGGKLITDSRPVNPLKLIKLTTSADIDDSPPSESPEEGPEKEQNKDIEETKNNVKTTTKDDLVKPVSPSEPSLPKFPKLIRIEDSIDPTNDESMIEKTEIVTEKETARLKSKLYVKLSGRSNTKPYEMDDKISEIYDLISSTVLNGKKTSSFIYGPRNSGKTMVFETALRKLKHEINGKKDKEFILIRINGLIQDDDKLAVRAIAEQLDSELSRIYNINLDELEAKELFSRKSINVTFSNILKILDNELNSGPQVAKIRTPIVFAIDEVDQFTNQSRQTLLYNLFDLVETSVTPISVLCFTTKTTVKETLEKRVRSRFSHRTIYFKRFKQEEFITVARKILSIDEPENDYEKNWNKNVEQLIETKTNFKRLLLMNYLTRADIKYFQNHCVYAVSQINPMEPYLKDTNFTQYADNLKKGSLKSIVNSLSDLELYLLVSSARVILKKDLNWVNLNLCYEEYESQIKAKNNEISSKTGAETITKTGLKTWSKENCRKSWELLQCIGLLSVVINYSGEFSNSSFETRVWQLEVTLDELRLIVANDRAAKSWTRL